MPEQQGAPCRRAGPVARAARAAARRLRRGCRRRLARPARTGCPRAPTPTPCCPRPALPQPAAPPARPPPARSASAVSVDLPGQWGSILLHGGAHCPCCSLHIVDCRAHASYCGAPRLRRRDLLHSKHCRHMSGSSAYRQLYARSAPVKHLPMMDSQHLGKGEVAARAGNCLRTCKSIKTAASASPVPACARRAASASASLPSSVVGRHTGGGGGPAAAAAAAAALHPHMPLSAG